MYQIIYLGKSADEAYKPLVAFKPFVPFRDASCGVSSFHLTVLDCLKGIQKARDVGFIDWNSGSPTWSVEEYQHYEQVVNGDLNWVLPGKLLAFSGPAARSNEVPGYRLHTPEDYWDYFRRKGITAIVRLNKKVYDRRRFTDGGFRHYDLYFPDGTCPTEAILLKWLEIAEAEPGGLAIHCKAGLGRTGILICAYLMKHFRFTAEEVIGYIRICRPGSVIGPQQNFICDIQARMWQEGDLYRSQRGQSRGVPASISTPDMKISGRNAISEPTVQDVTGPYRGMSAGGASAGVGASTGFSAQRNGRIDSASHASTTTADISLLQYKMYSSGSTVSPPSSNSKVWGSGTAAGVGGSSTRGPTGRSVTPMRYGSGGGSSSAYGYSLSGSSILSENSGGIGSITPPTSPTTSSMHRHHLRTGSAGGLYGAVGGGMLKMGGGGGPLSRSMRAPSADRAADRVPVSSLRATLHTDTLRAADRPRTGALSDHRTFHQSAAELGAIRVHGVGGGGSGGGSGSMANGGGGGGQMVQLRNGAPIARTLAPNGQPRKVPVSILPHYHAGLAAGVRAGAILATANSAAGGATGFGSRRGLQSK